MKEKFIDSALLAALVIVCVVIVFTLFSPSAGPFRRGAVPAVTSQNGAPSDTAIAPMDPTNEVTSAAEASPDDGLPSIDSSDEADTGASDPEIIPVAPTLAEQSSSETPLSSEIPLGTDTEASASGGTTNGAAEEANGAPPVAVEENEAQANGVSAGADELPSSLPPLPEGSFDLERIGFSYASGGVGACNIVLEPWRHIAVSPDILAKYPCGSELTVDLAEPVAGRERVVATVADTMPPSKVRTVNIYIGPDEPAFEYGVAEGALEP